MLHFSLDLMNLIYALELVASFWLAKLQYFICLKKSGSLSLSSQVTQMCLKIFQSLRYLLFLCLGKMKSTSANHPHWQFPTAVNRFVLQGWIYEYSKYRLNLKLFRQLLSASFPSWCLAAKSTFLRFWLLLWFWPQFFVEELPDELERVHDLSGVTDSSIG